MVLLSKMIRFYPHQVSLDLSAISVSDYFNFKINWKKRIYLNGIVTIVVYYYKQIK